MRNVWDEYYRGNQNTHFMIRNFFSENRAVYDIMWKHVVERGRAHMTIWLMGIASLITKATHTHTHNHSHYVIFIAFPLQQWSQKRAPILRLYVHCLSCSMLELLTHQGNRRL